MKIEGWPQIPNASSPFILLWKKSNLVFLRPRNRVNVQRFCAMPRLSLYQSLVQFLAVCKPAGTAVSSAQAQPGACLKSIWLLDEWLLGPHVCYRENTWAAGVGTYYWVREKVREPLSLLSSGYIISGSERTRCFCTLINQLPKLLEACAKPTL